MELKNISKKINEIDILTDINLNFEKGKIYSIIGRNGCGKSILLKIISGYINQTSGEKIYDENLKIAASLDEKCFIGSYTGYYNILNVFNYIDKKKCNRKIISDVFKMLEFEEYMDISVDKYSKGTKQKLAIAKCILEEFDVLILDEPFNAIDKKSKETIINYLLKIKEDKIIILTSHRKEEIDIADYTYMIEDGKIKQS